MKLPRRGLLGTGTWVGILVTAGAGLGLFLSPFGDGLDRFSFDLSAVLQRRTIPPEVTVIRMDEVSEQALRQPSDGPWDRRYHARLVDLLTVAGARLVVFDALFDNASADPEADTVFARSIKQNGRVVLGAHLVVERSEPVMGPPGGKMTHMISLVPIEPLQNAAAGYGYLSLPMDPDGAMRLHFPISKQYPSLAWTSARVLGAPGANVGLPALRWLRYYGPPGTLRSVSYVWALTNLENPAYRAPFRDQVVCVGASRALDTGHQSKIMFPTVYTRFRTERQHKYAPGAEIQATALVNLLHQDWLVRVPPGVELALLVLLGLLAGGGLTLVRLPAALGIGAALLVAIPVLGWVMHHWVGMWFGWGVFEVMIALGLFCALARYSVGREAPQTSLQNME